jgi:hypothetical protein
MDQKNRRRAGFYWIGDRPYLSVTEILKIIEKPAIRYWFGQTIYYAMVKDPTLSEQEAMAAPRNISRSKMDRGTTVHSLIEAYKTTGNVIDTVPDEFKGYANAFYKWANDLHPSIQECEKTIVSDEYGYAGTLDMLADIGGKRYVIDFKTSKDGTVYSEAHLQASAYIHCLEGCDGGILVGLAEDGTYTHNLVRDGFEAFKHALGLYQFINQDKLNKLGWRDNV